MGNALVDERNFAPFISFAKLTIFCFERSAQPDAGNSNVFDQIRSVSGSADKW